MNLWPNRTFLKYLAVQVPGWLLLLIVLLLLRSRVALSSWAAAALLGAWVLKDLLLYPLLRRAYEEDPRTGGERLVGKRGVAATPLAPDGYIRVKGELWRAHAVKTSLPLPEGSAVRVTAARGLTLTVEAE